MNSDDPPRMQRCPPRLFGRGIPNIMISKQSRVAGIFLLGLSLVACKSKSVTVTSASEEVRPDEPKTVKFDPKALERLGIQVAPAGAQNTGLDLELPGSLEYNLDKYAEVGTIVDGRVTSLKVKPGDHVKQGQVLATLVVPSIALAQADYLSAEASAKIAKENAGREQALLGKGLTTAREAEVARADESRSEAALGAAQAKLEALGVQRPSGETRISGAGTLILKAPLDGVVVRRDAVLGRFLQAKETAFVIADPTDLRASINVYEADLPYFRIGSQATIFIDAMPGKSVTGKIVLIEPQVGKASRAARAYIDLPNPDGILRSGLFIRASIRLPESTQHAGRVLVPAPAVQPVGDDDVVFVQREPGLFEVRKVSVVRRTTQVAEVREGLAPGEPIAVEGAFVLRGEVTKQ